MQRTIAIMSYIKRTLIIHKKNTCTKLECHTTSYVEIINPIQIQIHSCKVFVNVIRIAILNEEIFRN